MATAIDFETMVSVTDFDCDEFAVNAAVIVTVFPTGIAAGAVKTDAVPLAVCAELRVPHAPPVRLPVTGFPWQVTVQSTPAFCASPDVVSATLAEPVIARESIAFPPESTTVSLPAVALILLPHPVTPISANAHTRQTNADRLRLKLAKNDCITQ
jgi:hypothetical protein